MKKILFATGLIVCLSLSIYFYYFRPSQHLEIKSKVSADDLVLIKDMRLKGWDNNRKTWFVHASKAILGGAEGIAMLKLDQGVIYDYRSRVFIEDVVATSANLNSISATLVLSEVKGVAVVLGKKSKLRVKRMQFAKISNKINLEDISLISEDFAIYASQALANMDKETEITCYGVSGNYFSYHLVAESLAYSDNNLILQGNAIIKEGNNLYGAQDVTIGKQLLLSGNVLVKLASENLTIKAGKLIKDKNLLFLSGKVEVRSKGKQIRSQELIYDIKKHSFEAKGKIFSKISI